jgi:hypothetical protein
LFAFTHSWFVLGGGGACLSVAGKHWRLARKNDSAARRTAVVAVQGREPNG